MSDKLNIPAEALSFGSVSAAKHALNVESEISATAQDHTTIRLYDDVLRQIYSYRLELRVGSRKTKCSLPSIANIFRYRPPRFMLMYIYVYTNPTSTI